ncbi:MAG: GMC family oxidoreductase N-terminal domain-containing protein [Chloroflexota bacterium]|nr:GMC family oxidoreductase N-terminal domain-containing protein [Chloroflexota bacterium]
MSVPREADTIVIGGGTAGAVVAGLLAEQSDERVLVLEAGPDFGPFGGGQWPADLLDARALGYTHDWRYASGDTYAGRIVNFERAKVIGGCSAHNGCAAIWGSRVDYDGWAEIGLDGWSAADLLPVFARANDRLRVRQYGPTEITPFQQACLDAAPGAGIPLTDDLNNFDEDQRMAPSPVNIVAGTRWNTAFAYLDPVRSRPNLTIEGNCSVDRLVIRQGRVAAVRYIGPDGSGEVAATRFVVAGGTYGSPAVLLRSGIGNPAELRELGIEPAIPLAGVGKNLHDHSSVRLVFAGTPRLEAAMKAFGAVHWMPEEQTIAKIRSRLYPQSEPGFDLHLYPVGGPDSSTDSGWRWYFPIACMTPRSRGAVCLRSADPRQEPRIEHAYISDADGHDRALLVDGVRIGRELAAQPALTGLLGDEHAPGPSLVDDSAIERWIDDAIEHYYHPVGTCAMGLETDPAAVTNARGRIHGLDNAYVADCSIMPVIPRANTNIPAVVVGERIAGWLLSAG